MSTRRFFSKPELRPTLSLRINETTKESLLRRARAQSERERRPIKPSQVARALLEYALTMVDERARPRTPEDELIDEVMAAALFARRAFEIILSTHEGLAEELLRASRNEVRHSRGRGEQ